MCPLELVATATDSPRYSPGGSLRKFGTEVKGISGTFWALAFCCARAGAAAHSIKAAAQTDVRLRCIESSRKLPMNFTVWAVASGQIYANRPAASTETTA